ncbi:hypothetical protein [Geobacter sp.]|uniref:hypothetical protein n=1 Tax=Geobacter sp. TaxID=46610 RepID=UPI0027B9E691|nr:hypothetical protein [Geobacter sp.]
MDVVDIVTLPYHGGKIVKGYKLNIRLFPGTAQQQIISADSVKIQEKTEGSRRLRAGVGWRGRA